MNLNKNIGNKKIITSIIILVIVLLAYSLFTKYANHEVVEEQEVGQEEVTKLSWKKFSEKASSGEYIIIDVRTLEEIAEGKLFDDALEIDFRNENFEIEILKLNKEYKYLLYCKAGGRSGGALKLMKNLGFKEIYDLEGGYDGVMISSSN